jgi:hypothetical protein
MRERGRVDWVAGVPGEVSGGGEASRRGLCHVLGTLRRNRMRFHAMPPLLRDVSLWSVGYTISRTLVLSKKLEFLNQELEVYVNMC